MYHTLDPPPKNDGWILKGQSTESIVLRVLLMNLQISVRNFVVFLSQERRLD